MKRLTTTLAASCALAVVAVTPPIVVRAADVSPSPASSPGLSYDDPAIHFEAPPGWERVNVQPPEGAAPGTKTVVFAKSLGKPEQKTIILMIAPYDGSLDGLETSTESELRSAEGASVFVDSKTKTTLANGMPAWWLKVSAGDQAGKMYRRYEYVAFDGMRGITAAVVARLGDLEEREAKDVLKTLTVVLYPRDR